MSRGFRLPWPHGRDETSPAHSQVPSKRQVRIAAVAAPVVTVAAIGVGIASTAMPSSSDLPGLAAAAETADRAAGAATISRTAISSAERSASISRSFTRAAIPEVTGKLWTSRDLKLRLKPTEDARDAGDFETMKRIPVTGTKRGDYTQVVLKKKVYWVTSEYLSKKKPTTPESMGLSNADCPRSASGGLVSGAQRVMNAVCAAFPEITTYGGRAGRGEHGTGRASDIMVSGDRGEQVRDYLYAHRYQLNLFNIIYAQRIWTIQRDGEGFRGMSNRGSATANHFDHVHVLVN